MNTTQGVRLGLAVVSTFATLVIAGACGTDDDAGVDRAPAAPAAPAAQRDPRAHQMDAARERLNASSPGRLSADTAERKYPHRRRYDPAHPPVSPETLERHYGGTPRTSVDPSGRHMGSVL